MEADCHCHRTGIKHSKTLRAHISVYLRNYKGFYKLTPVHPPPPPPPTKKQPNLCFWTVTQVANSRVVICSSINMHWMLAEASVTECSFQPSVLMIKSGELEMSTVFSNNIVLIFQYHYYQSKSSLINFHLNTVVIMIRIITYQAEL